MQGRTTEAVAPAPRSAYLIAGQQFWTDSSGFAEAIASAHVEHHRPRCLCLHGGIEMYVARLGPGFIVKRMPNSGSRHAHDCPSYEPPPEFSGLGQLLGTAINEDPATGETTLKLGFALSRTRGRSNRPPADSVADSVVSNGTKLSLRGLLHYLWDQAELTRWHPGFAGKRSWATVRKHLLQVAESKIALGDVLSARLYIPEVFAVAQRDEINERRVGQCAHAVSRPRTPQQLMLLIAEVKQIVPARYGYKVVIKHVPDQAFALDEQLYRRMCRRFESELSLWGATVDVHMVMIATFSVSATGIPSITELSLMPATDQWLPVDDSFDMQLVGMLVRNGRRFIKGLRYNLPQGRQLASALLIDSPDSPTPLFIASDGNDESWHGTDLTEARLHTIQASWIWSTTKGAMPPLPRAINSEPDMSAG